MDSKMLNFPGKSVRQLVKRKKNGKGSFSVFKCNLF